MTTLADRMFLYVDKKIWDVILTLLPVDIDAAKGGQVMPSLLSLACSSKGFHNVVVTHLGELTRASLGSDREATSLLPAECATLATTAATIWRFLRQTPRLVHLSLSDLRFVDDILLEGIATLCPFLVSLDLQNCAAQGRNRNCSISVYGVEQGICRLHNLTSLNLNRCCIQGLNRSHLARMLVAALPLLTSLNLGTASILSEIGGEDIAVIGGSLENENAGISAREVENDALLEVMAGQFTNGFTTISLSGQEALESVGVRRLLHFEASCLTELDFSFLRLPLRDSDMVLTALSTCRRLVTLTLHGCFEWNRRNRRRRRRLRGLKQLTLISTDSIRQMMRKLSKLEFLDVRLCEVQDEASCLEHVVTPDGDNEKDVFEGRRLQELRTDWRPNSKCLRGLAEHMTRLTHLDLCFRFRPWASMVEEDTDDDCAPEALNEAIEPLAATIRRRRRYNERLVDGGASTSDFELINHPPPKSLTQQPVISLAARLVSLKLGGQAGALGLRGGIADDSLSITLALATSLTELRLRGCNRVSAQSFSRMGEGRGLVAIFVKRSQRRRHVAAVINSAVCRIDAVPQSVRERLVLNGLTDLRRGESYEYKVKTTNRFGQAVGDDWDQWDDDLSREKKQKKEKKTKKSRSNFHVPVDILARVLRSPSEPLQSAREELADATRGICAHAAPSGSYENADIVLQTSQWRSIASSVPLLSLSLISCPLVDDRAIRIILSRTPLLREMRLVSLVQIVDPVSPIGSHHYASGEDALCARAWQSLETLELNGLHRLKQSAATSLGRVLRNETLKQLLRVTTEHNDSTDNKNEMQIDKIARENLRKVQQRSRKSSLVNKNKRRLSDKSINIFDTESSRCSSNDGDDDEERHKSPGVNIFKVESSSCSDDETDEDLKWKCPPRNEFDVESSRYGSDDGEENENEYLKQCSRTVFEIESSKYDSGSEEEEQQEQQHRNNTATKRISKSSSSFQLSHLQLSDLPLWPALAVSRLLRCLGDTQNNHSGESYPCGLKLSSLSVSRMSFDDRCLEALTRYCQPSFRTLRLGEIPTETRPRMSAEGLARFVLECTSLTTLEMPTDDIIMVDDAFAMREASKAEAKATEADVEEEDKHAEKILREEWKKQSQAEQALVQWDYAADNDRKGLIRTPIQSSAASKRGQKDQISSRIDAKSRRLLTKVRQKQAIVLDLLEDEGSENTDGQKQYTHYRNFRRFLEYGRLPLRLCFGDVVDLRGTPGGKILGQSTQLSSTLKKDIQKDMTEHQILMTEDEQKDMEDACIHEQEEPYYFDAYDFFDDDRPWAVDLEEDQRILAMRERNLMDLRRIAQGGEAQGIEALSALRQKYNMKPTTQRKNEPERNKHQMNKCPPNLRLLKDKQRQRRKKAALARLERLQKKAKSDKGVAKDS